MSGSIFVHGWATIIGSLATIAIIVIALGLLLGVLKLAEALKRIGALLGIVILLTLIPGAFATLWFAMSVWQRIALAVMGITILWWRRPRGQTRKAKEK